ncbi:MAG: T9SS type A sorting domain-containing protein [Chitinophagales bacterium]|nr:T9SS type A sorting domain-containing protein [Chitinophagales bacterium]MDW8394537.1 T9SS type A sorting domain-containing protein [Chitinophagales bacterium]
MITHPAQSVLLSALGLLLLGSEISAQAIRRDWHKDLPLYAPAEVSYARVAVDQAGSAYWAVNCQDLSSSLKYIWLVKYDSSGAHQWSQYYDAFHGAFFSDLTCDPDGNTYLFGTALKAAGNGTAAAFLRKYSSNGQLLWSLIMDPDINAEEQPDQIALSPVNGDVIATLSTYSSVNTCFVARYSPQGSLLWQQSFLNYRSGDLQLDPYDRLHLVTTYFLGPSQQDQRWCYLQLNGQGQVNSSFTQAGGQYSHAIETGGVGRTSGLDHSGNFYALGWVKAFPFQDSAWTNIMVYKFNPSGLMEWSYRLKRVRKGYPNDFSKLLVDPSSGEVLVSGGSGAWKYGTAGNFVTGWYNSIRHFVDAAAFSQQKTFLLSTTWVPNNDDNGKISLLDWSKSDSIYIKGRSDIQMLNETALITPDSSRLAMYVTWCYAGKAELHRLVLRDSLTGIHEGNPHEQPAFYPNPAAEQVVLHTGPYAKEQADLFIFNSEGQLLIRQKVNRQAVVSLDVRKLASGSYFVLLSGKTSHWSSPLIIQ